MKKFPKEIRIGGHCYRVKFPYKKMGFKWAAEVNHDKLQIRVSDKGLNGQKRARSVIEESLLHEIVHAVNIRYLPTHLKIRESQVEQLSTGLYQVLHEHGLKF